MDEVLMQIDGQNGKAIAYEDRIVLSRKGFNGYIAQGLTGDRSYFYRDITAIDFRKPSIWGNGFLKVITAGIQDNNIRRMDSIKSTMKMMEDPNTLILRAFKKVTADKYEEFYNLIMQKVNENKNNVIIQNNNISAADEIKKYKELLDMGAITKEEFDKKKAELLQ